MTSDRVPLISLTTATFNCESTLPRTIESILAQEYPNIEYVVMDGLSGDRTVEVARSYEDAFAERNWSFRIVSQADRGMYDAINQGMEICSGKLLVNVNGDDYLEPGGLAAVADAYAKKGFDIAYCDLRVHTGKGTFIKKAAKMGAWPTSRTWNHPTMFLANRALGLRYRIDNPYADFDLYLRAAKSGMIIETLPVVVSNFLFGGMSTKRSWADVRKRIGWRNQIYRDNGCPFMTYVEGVAIEVAKYFKA